MLFDANLRFPDKIRLLGRAADDVERLVLYPNRAIRADHERSRAVNLNGALALVADEAEDEGSARCGVNRLIRAQPAFQGAKGGVYEASGCTNPGLPL